MGHFFYAIFKEFKYKKKVYEQGNLKDNIFLNDVVKIYDPII